MRRGYYCLFTALFMGTLLFSPPGETKTIEAKIGQKKYVLEVADTIIKRSRGLSNRKDLATDKGMLFVFKSPGNHKFCMDSMRFPLDLIWIKGNTVTGLTENIPFPGQKSGNTNRSVKIEEFTFNEKFDKAIELNAGEIKKSRIKLREKIDFLD